MPHSSPAPQQKYSIDLAYRPAAAVLRRLFVPSRVPRGRYAAAKSSTGQWITREPGQRLPIAGCGRARGWSVFYVLKDAFDIVFVWHVECDDGKVVQFELLAQAIIRFPEHFAQQMLESKLDRLDTAGLSQELSEIGSPTEVNYDSEELSSWHRLPDEILCQV